MPFADMIPVLALADNPVMQIDPLIWQGLIHDDEVEYNPQLLTRQRTLHDYFVPSSGAQVMNLDVLRVRALRWTSADQWDAIQQDSALCAYLKHHCLECGRWFSRAQDLIVHLREAHPTMLLPGVEQMVKLERQLKVTSPCPFCNQTWARLHGCSVLLQRTLLRDQQVRDQALRQESSTSTVGPVAGPVAGAGGRWPVPVAGGRCRWRRPVPVAGAGGRCR